MRQIRGRRTGLWIHFFREEDTVQYLQLQTLQFCHRAGARQGQGALPSALDGNLRDPWHSRAQRNAANFNLFCPLGCFFTLVQSTLAAWIYISGLGLAILWAKPPLSKTLLEFWVQTSSKHATETEIGLQVGNPSEELLHP